MKQEITQGNNLMPNLIKELSEAENSIYLAIGWLADKHLFGLLEKKARKGTNVKIILIKDKENEALATDYQSLTQQGVQLIWLTTAEREQLIDHKFAVIDGKQILSGNYNWGHKNPPKEELLTFHTNSPTLVQGFMEEFEYLSVLNQLSTTTSRPKNTIGELLRKLNILKVLLSIGDTEFIHLRLQILERFATDENIQAIHQAILQKDFEGALASIKKFIHDHQVLQACIEPPVEHLQREIQRLEEEIAAISQEFNETQKVIHEFSKLHSEALGDLLQKILFQSKIKAAYEAKQDSAKQAEFEEAKSDHEEYSKSFEASKKQKLNNLSKAEKKELKKLYRQTSLRCHPDRVVDDLHDQAEEIFVELNQAYKANDLERVREISEQMKSGTMLSKSETITELKKLASTANSLKQKLQDWLSKLDVLKAQPTYKTISNIDDWTVYFSETKVILGEQLTRLLSFNKGFEVREQQLLE